MSKPNFVDNTPLPGGKLCVDVECALKGWPPPGEDERQAFLKSLGPRVEMGKGKRNRRRSSKQRKSRKGRKSTKRGKRSKRGKRTKRR